MIHYPLTPIHDIFKTEMKTFKGSLVNVAKVIREGLTGFTLFDLRDADYCFIAEEWESTTIDVYNQMQNEEFRKQYGEEY